MLVYLGNTQSAWNYLMTAVGQVTNASYPYTAVKVT